MDRFAQVCSLSAVLLVWLGCSGCALVDPGGDELGTCSLTGSDPAAIGGSGESCFSAPSDPGSVSVEVYTSKSEFMSALEGCGQTVTFEDVDVCQSNPAEIQPDRYVPSFGLRLESNKSQWVGTKSIWSDDFEAVSGERQFAAGNPERDADTANNVTMTFPGTGSEEKVAGIGVHVTDADYGNQQATTLSVADGQGNTLESRQIETDDAATKFTGFVAVDGGGNPVAAFEEATLVLGNGWPGTGSNEGVTADDFVVSTE